MNDELLDRIHAELTRNTSAQERLQREADALRLTASILQRGPAPQTAKCTASLGRPKIPIPTGIDLSGAETLDDCLLQIGEAMETFGSTEAARLIMQARQQPETPDELQKLRYRLRYRLEKSRTFTKVRPGQYSLDTNAGHDQERARRLQRRRLRHPAGTVEGSLMASVRRFGLPATPAGVGWVIPPCAAAFRVRTALGLLPPNWPGVVASIALPCLYSDCRHIGNLQSCSGPCELRRYIQYQDTYFVCNIGIFVLQLNKV